MTSQDMMLDMMRAQGKSDALDLRGKAKDMDGTEIIAQERKAPPFDPKKDYSEWPVGAPVQEDGQVYTLLQPYNAANHPGSNPKNYPAGWSICHTKDPKKAKPYLPPNGQSGLYKMGEVCTKDGHVWRSKKDGNEFPPGEVGTEDFWEALEV